jgi:RNA polymerase sigma-70 factor, ECF subfamily
VTRTAGGRTVWDQEEAVQGMAPAVTPHGRPEEFEAFFLEHHRDVFACFRLLARDRHEAEEISQEAFLRVWQRWDRVSTMERPEGYLFRTAMNVFRSRRRRAAAVFRRLGRREHGGPEATGGGGPSGADPAISVVEDRDAVARELAGLPARQRAAFVLTEGLGLSSEEAGQAMGITASTVRVQVARARESLRGRRETNDG